MSSDLEGNFDFFIFLGKGGKGKGLGSGKCKRGIWEWEIGVETVNGRVKGMGEWGRVFWVECGLGYDMEYSLMECLL